MATYYTYSRPDKYFNHIGNALQDREAFNTLFQWKNGQTLSAKKQCIVDSFWEKKDILIQLQAQFDWDLFESGFEPDKNACIWKIFLLHIALPADIPIYDQHVYRAIEFIRTGEIREIPYKNKDKYVHFKDVYNPWFQQAKVDHGFDVKFIDEACFAFGKALQKFSMLPYQVYGS